jgi:hypothetical protein
VGEEGSAINVRRIAVRCSNPAPATTFPFVYCAFSADAVRVSKCLHAPGRWRGLEEDGSDRAAISCQAQTSVIAVRIADPNVMDQTRRLL